MPIKKSKFENVIAYKVPFGAQPNTKFADLFASIVCFLGGKRGISQLSLGVFFNRIIAVVEEIARQMMGREVGRIRHELLVHEAVPASGAGRENAHDLVGIPSAVVNPVTTIVGEPVETKRGGLCFLLFPSQ